MSILKKLCCLDGHTGEWNKVLYCKANVEFLLLSHLNDSYFSTGSFQTLLGHNIFILTRNVVKSIGIYLLRRIKDVFPINTALEKCCNLKKFT